MDIVDGLREEASFAHKVTGCSIKRHSATRAANEIERLRAAVAEAVAAERERVNMLRAFVADDAIACTFQTLGQYRVALLRALRA